MSGISPAQARNHLIEWMGNVEEKVKTLHRGGRFYMVLNYLFMVFVAVITVILLALQSYKISNPNIGFGIAALILQAILAFFNVSLSVISPSAKSARCYVCSKSYDAFRRSLSIQVDKMDSYDQVASEELYQMMLCYILQETSILIQEPGLVFYKHKSGTSEPSRNIEILPV